MKTPRPDLVGEATLKLTMAIGRTDLPIPHNNDGMQEGLSKYADILTATVEWITQHTEV